MSEGGPPLPVPPGSNSSDMESVQDFLNSFGADTVLRSSDSCDVRVQRLYIAKFSPVLGALIQGATNSTVPPNAEAPLLVVQLPESGATLTCLLSFISPFPLALPSTSAIEATMELLSAVQKYEMSSVLAHIRLILAQQDPPFIRKDNALRAYSLAQKYRLRQEVLTAAQLTLRKFRSDVVTFQSLEGELDNLPGVYLHELWKFHERFLAFLKSDLTGFRNSSVKSMLKGLQCISRAPSGIPKWLDDYSMQLTFNFPFFFDSFKFQKAWVEHVRQCECILLPQTFHKIWAAMKTVIRESVEKAGLDLSILGEKTHYEAHIVSPTTPLSLPKGMDVSLADVIVRSSDHVDFRVHKSILACSSPVFNDMFSLPQPSDDEAVDGLQIVELTEDSELVRALITALYPIPSELPTSHDRILALLSAAQKYDMGPVQSSIRAEVCRKRGSLFTLNETQVFRAYAMASRWKLIPEMKMAAHLSLDHPMTFDSLGDELRLFEGWALRALLKFRMHYRDNLIPCFKSFADTSTGPSKIWNACPGPKLRFSNVVGSISSSIFFERVEGMENSRGVPGPPAWLHDVFRFSKESTCLWLPMYPFVAPSDIRAKYLLAMQEHVTKDKCTSCLEAHAMKGETYIVELERAVTQARDKTTLEVS